MAGHSKWANIKHKKAANDKKRGKVWTKLIREVTVAAREGRTSDPGTHPRLRLAVDKALGANIPKDTIEKACKRGAGELDDGASYEQARYEGYGPGGVAIMVDCLTDNRNRTVSEVRHAFTKLGGNLGTDGSVAYLFNKTGVISFYDNVDEDAVMEAALEAEADDVVTNDDGSIEVLTSPEEYQRVKDAIEAAGLRPDNAEVTMRPETLSAVDVDTAETVLRMIDMLEDLDDVQEVYTNADFPDEVLDRLAS
ncbi:MAG TPA: YebC/PmpR family DNA-binding transcriptional regulator [Thiohalobacter sp.]|nr:YebC/PmpR family DNA-binding transcriptional regulator [Thiohalobacter sp.]